MDSESTRQILTAPIVLLRPSTEEERGLFHNKKNGWFYTFGLKSGQSFVARFSKGNDEQNIFLFRPLKNLVPQLAQFQWQRRKHLFTVFPIYLTTCQTTPMTSQEETKILAEILEPTRIDVPRKHFWNEKVFRWRYPEMLVKAHQIKEQLMVNMDMRAQLFEHQKHMKQSLLEGQRRLQSLMIPNNNVLMDHTVRRIINERGQRNG